MRQRSSFGYLLGSIPFGLLLTKLAGSGDIRSIGSGNIGATNVLRTGRKGLAAATLLGDMLKGTAAVLMPIVSAATTAVLAALGAFLGHVFPVWLGFKGGKGVATYIGVLLAFAWPAALAFCAIWLAVAALTRYSSRRRFAPAPPRPLCSGCWMTGRRRSCSAADRIVWVMHRGNIPRLLEGTEGRIGAKAH